MRLPEEPDNPPQLNILPMIDVIFALLTFFILSTLSLTRSEGLPVNLPKAATAQPQSSSQIVVTLNQQGQLTLNRRPAQLGDLQTRIRALMGNNPNAVVVINADERVSHGQVIAVMDRLRLIPGVRLAIAAQRPAP
ncbi:biopolymer transporter ExbD [Phormidium sp. FACHB-592]|uniref:Biopolymer transporter ExbD n=1 Tax=Stenomitos frigidus AS-A4 TaxID=2933935 RepID=A0ABV0KQY0_9CYAN|nr:MULTISPECIES: biopolymer transporter ExbD [Cyanophyceae]MBD2036947.1 biopolymer transporter ExbD [Leptolyngbya sp. FACHB-321]MBD2077922.1 biopolymer transporter ExbD [Phormidium sp. FACHB-592]